MKNQKEVQVIGMLDVQRRIIAVRGVQVMLDRDLAALYGVETRVLNQAVRRNIGRFPEDFMFQLSKEDCLRSQIVTLNTTKTMNEIEQIQYRIHEIRSQKVMLDFDLAALYGVETKRLNEQVKRNIERFPEDFMFQLTKGEWVILQSQIATTNSTENEDINFLRSQIATTRGMRMKRSLPYAFTENGVAMLSSVLRSPLAIQMNIGIMRVFTEIRRMAATLALPDSNAELRREIQAVREEMNEILADQNEINEDTRAQLDAISTALAELQDNRPRQRHRTIGFIQQKENE